MQTENEQTTDLVDVDNLRPVTPAEQIIAPLNLSDSSQFLYSTNYGGTPGTDFTADGIKTIGLRDALSTGDVPIEFLNPEKTEVWDADTGSQIIDDLQNLEEWVQSSEKKAPF